VLRATYLSKDSVLSSAREYFDNYMRFSDDILIITGSFNAISGSPRAYYVYSEYKHTSFDIDLTLNTHQGSKVLRTSMTLEGKYNSFMKALFIRVFGTSHVIFVNESLYANESALARRGLNATVIHELQHYMDDTTHYEHLSPDNQRADSASIERALNDLGEARKMTSIIEMTERQDCKDYELFEARLRRSQYPGASLSQVRLIVRQLIVDVSMRTFDEDYRHAFSVIETRASKREAHYLKTVHSYTKEQFGQHVIAKLDDIKSHLREDGVRVTIFGLPRSQILMDQYNYIYDHAGELR